MRWRTRFRLAYKCGSHGDSDCGVAVPKVVHFESFGQWLRACATEVEASIKGGCSVAERVVQVVKAALNVREVPRSADVVPAATLEPKP